MFYEGPLLRILSSCVLDRINPTVCVCVRVRACVHVRVRVLVRVRVCVHVRVCARVRL